MEGNKLVENNYFSCLEPGRSLNLFNPWLWDVLVGCVWIWKFSLILSVRCGVLWNKSELVKHQYFYWITLNLALSSLMLQGDFCSEGVQVFWIGSSHVLLNRNGSINRRQVERQWDRKKRDRCRAYVPVMRLDWRWRDY